MSIVNNKKNSLKTTNWAPATVIIKTGKQIRVVHTVGRICALTQAEKDLVARIDKEEGRVK